VRKKSKGKKTDKEKKINLNEMHILGLIFCVFTFLLIMVQVNVQYAVRESKLNMLDKDELIRLKNESDIKNTSDPDILLIIEDDPSGIKAQEVLIPVLDQMKEHYDVCYADEFDASLLDKYNKIVIAITKYQKLGESIADIKTWVKEGGNLMIAYPPEISGSFQSMYGILGIKDGWETSFVEGVHIKSDFMIGGTKHDFWFDEPFDSSLGLVLKDDCEIFIESTGAYPTPLLWRRNVEKGTIVFDNFGIMEKSYRGFHCAAFSLLDDYCVYPVINASVFYIDDFPAPVPLGNGEYISRDYNLSISDFYSQIWWKDVYDISKKYDIVYTGLVIEDYSNQVKGEFARNEEIYRFRYFGNMLLKSGGEIGIHGYNHMPLVLENFDYEGQYDEYVQWPSKENMRNSVDEVYDFSSELFPREELQVYVPPSNILSEDGIEVLDEKGIKSIASVYLSGDLAYEQEFEVSKENGIINTPRIISGYVINDYMQFAAFSELNFHYVNSHFQHPDDVLDEDRGAQLGWETLYSRFADYLDWLYTSCPNIRNLTGSEFAGAVQRYDLIGVNRVKKDKAICLNLDNFEDESWMFLRLNEDQNIIGIRGGEYTEAADDLYLVKCTEDNVVIELDK